MVKNACPAVVVKNGCIRRAQNIRLANCSASLYANSTQRLLPCISPALPALEWLERQGGGLEGHRHAVACKRRNHSPGIA